MKPLTNHSDAAVCRFLVFAPILCLGPSSPDQRAYFELGHHTFRPRQYFGGILLLLFELEEKFSHVSRKYCMELKY